MKVRLFRGATTGRVRIPIYELEGKGYEPQEVNADIKAGVVTILSGVEFGPALEPWTIKGWDIRGEEKTLATFTLKEPVDLEKGDVFRIPAGLKINLED
jgi:hypothetical protein